MEPILLRVSEAGALLGISRSKAYELVAGRQIPSIRIGSSLRIPLAGLREWVEGQTGTSQERSAS